MTVNARWVTIDGQQLLSITLPGRQYIQLDPYTGWCLLLVLRWAMRHKPPPGADNGEHEA